MTITSKNILLGIVLSVLSLSATADQVIKSWLDGNGVDQGYFSAFYARYNAETTGKYYATFSMLDTSTGNFVVSCSGIPLVLPLDIVPGAMAGEVSFAVGDGNVSCSVNIPGITEVSAQCKYNGNFHQIAIGQIINNNESGTNVYHGTSIFSGVDCVVQVDGYEFNLSGQAHTESEKIKGDP